MLTILFDGIAYGMLLFILALGLAVTMGLMNFINLAHGAFAMAGGYITVLLMQRLDVPFLLCLPAAFLGAALLGAILTGAGGTFCSGMDLKGFLKGELPVAGNRGFGGLTSWTPKKPVIAAVDGAAAGAGID